MKKIIFLFILFYHILPIHSQQIILSKDKWNRKAVPTGVLYEKIKLPDKSLSDFKAINNRYIKKPAHWLSLYHNIFQASYQKSFHHFLQLKKKAKKDLDKQIIDIGIINYRYNRIDNKAWKNNKARIENNNIIINDKKLIITKTLFAVSPIVNKKYTGKNITFNFSDTYYFSNIDSPVKYILINFDDGKGKQKINLNRKITVHYQNTGLKKINLEIVLMNGQHYRSGFYLRAQEPTMPSPDESWVDYTADISYNGSAAQGEVAVFFGNGNTDFTRPVIISDGFDPGNIRDLSEIYDIVNQQSMVDTLRQRGYDLVLVNFNGGDDYIQRNAMLIVKLIQDINARMQSAGTMKPANQIAVVGPSMSGLITRYALKYMEQNNIPHNVRNWIAFDSPMKGANVPLGVQHWLRFYAEEAEVSGAQDALQTLQGPAAKQMLTYYYTATSGQSAGHHSLYTSFFNEINSMGFPQQTRIVAIANGSGYGNGQPYTPGTQTIEYSYRSFLVDLDGDVWAIPNQNSTKIFYGVYDELGFWAYEEENIYVNNTYPYDSGAGGTRSTFQELADTDTGGYGDIIAYYPDHAFIPTISSLAIQNTNDPYYNINANLNNLTTPFDKLYFPDYNQFHIEITSESIEWFKHEIINFPPVFTSTPVLETDEESLYTYTFSATDENEWNTIDFDVVQLPSWLTYDANTHTLSGTPSYNDIGTHTVSIKATDGLDDTFQNFQIVVTKKCTHAPVTEWDGNNWSNGIPDISNFVRINADYNTELQGAINACMMKVENGKHLIIHPDNPVQVERDIVNDGEIIVKDEAALVQTSDKAEISGNGYFSVERKAGNLHHYYDYVYWSSPINSHTLTLDEIIPDAWRYYQFDAASQSWIFDNGTSVWQPAKAYAISAPNGFTGGIITAIFEKNNDPFNTGIIETPLIINGSGATDDDDWQLVGNPYPSAIDFHKLVTDNPAVQGSYYVWTNCAGLNGNSHQESGYSVYSLSGAVPACQNGNYTASRYINSAQGFYIEANSSGNLKFSNTQRVAYHNDNFASRPSGNKLRLDLSDNNGKFNQILIDFNTSATTGLDRLYDAKAMDNGSGQNFYSLSGNTKLTIQALPVLSNDDCIIHLGYQSSNNGNLKIHLNNYSGILQQKNVYLIDHSLQTVHDLKQSDYTFIHDTYPENERFELLITDNLLSNTSLQKTEVLIYQTDNQIVIMDSSGNKFHSVKLYDINGKLLYNNENLSVSQWKFTIENSKIPVLIKINYDKTAVIKKLILK
jgi:hypothetical protein